MKSFVFGPGYDMSKSDLRDGVFRNANLRNAIFTSSDLRGADFYNADVSYVSFAGADLRGAVLTEADLFSSSFNNADLRHVEGIFVHSGTPWGYLVAYRTKRVVWGLCGHDNLSIGSDWEKWAYHKGLRSPKMYRHIQNAAIEFFS